MLLSQFQSQLFSQFHTSKKDLQHHDYKVTADFIRYQLLSS